MNDLHANHESSHDHPTTSILGILSLYSGMRRQGSTAEAAIHNLEESILQLSSADRRELDAGIQDWETKRGKQADDQAFRDADDPFNATPPPPTGAHSERDGEATVGGATIEALLQKMQPLIACAMCTKRNDPKLESCAFCGARLSSAPIPTMNPAHDVTWFGPDSRLQLNISGASEPIEIAVHNTVTLGRHTPLSAISDIDLSPFSAETLGVSRLHASIKRDGATLILADMRSTNHTFANGKRLGEAEGYTLKHGDRIAVGSLKMTVAFLHDNVPSRR